MFVVLFFQNGLTDFNEIYIVYFVSIGTDFNLVSNLYDVNIVHFSEIRINLEKVRKSNQNNIFLNFLLAKLRLLG